MLSLLASDEPQNRVELINRLASSSSPYALCLLEEMLERESDSHLIGYAHQAIPAVKEQIFQAFKEARAIEKEKAKKEFEKLESAVVQEHIEALLGLSYYLHQKNELNSPKKHFARAYALDPSILENEAYQDLGCLVFGSYPAGLKAEVEEFVKLQNKYDRVLERDYPWYMHMFDYSMLMSWIALIVLCLVTYLTLTQEYPARCSNRGRAGCVNWAAAQADDFARIAPMLPRTPIAIGLMILFLGTGLRLFHYILQSQKQIVNINWRNEARGNVFEDIEEELLKVFTPRAKKT
jgi:hypothetical protein